MQPHPIPFKAETRQLLDILIHSLYTERDIFLRELVSNASDALTRLNFEMLTNRDVLDPEAEAAIWIETNPEARTLTIRDTGIGMNAEEMVENLGTIAHSGARSFLQAVEQNGQKAADVIGQFGVGFYSAFMVADRIQVVSRSYRPTDEAAEWISTGADTYEIHPSEKASRGTEITIFLKEDAAEYTQLHRLRAIIKKHSDFIPFPIYLGDEKEQVNQQTAIWRKNPRQVESADYDAFYRQFTLNTDAPLLHVHLNVDAPVQLYALLYIPPSAEKPIFSLRREEGLKLYARKILIQEYSRDLLPDYLRFVEGIVDSEDLPLSVSREAVQSTRTLSQIKRLLTTRVIDALKSLAADQPEQFAKFWKHFSANIKQGLATDAENREALLPLLHFNTLQSPATLRSLDAYVQAMPEGQKAIFYLLGSDPQAMRASPHLELYTKLGFDVLLLSDPLDSFVLLNLSRYKEHPLLNIATDHPDLPKSAAESTEADPTPDAPEGDALIERFKTQLGERVSGITLTRRLVNSPARLVDTNDGLPPEVQHVYRLLNKEFETPRRRLEINPDHPLIQALSATPANHPLSALTIEQIFSNALWMEGETPQPDEMITRMSTIMEAALRTAQ